MATQEVPVKANLNIVLKSDTEQLEEVMVVAYGTAKKSAFTGSAATIKNEKIATRQTSNVTNALAGQVAGVQTTSNNGQPGKDAEVRIRGIGSISASNKPLYVVDGVPYDGEISAISTSDIESVSILKDAAAVALYGYKGVNGAILITTKRGKYKTKEITFTYDHIINTQSRRPEFVDAATYASAVNEARGYEGLGARYTPEEVNAFRNGVGSGGASRMYPYLYPNVNWIDETFKDRGVSSIQFTLG